MRVLYSVYNRYPRKVIIEQMLDSICTRIESCSNPVQLTDLRSNSLIDSRGVARKFSRIALTIRGIALSMQTRKRRLRIDRTCCSKQFVTSYRYDTVTEEMKLNTQKFCSSVFRNAVCVFYTNKITLLFLSFLFSFFIEQRNVSINDVQKIVECISRYL